MKQIPLGTKGSFNLLVQPEHLANRFKDATLPPVLATPVMIMAMENAALNAVRPYLDPGESAVGTAVNVRHLAATPLGRLVTAEAEVTKVEGAADRVHCPGTRRRQGDRRRFAFQGSHRHGQIHAAPRVSTRALAGSATFPMADNFRRRRCLKI
jgi:predicted thioesterase